MAEVLVRLRQEEAALMPPGEFFPVFEQHGLMPEPDRWVVRHAVKVDGSIVRKLLADGAAERKLRAIQEIGAATGFKLVAEMVEDQDILLRLKALGVAYAQGFGICQPHPIGQLAAAR